MVALFILCAWQKYYPIGRIKTSQIFSKKMDSVFMKIWGTPNLGSNLGVTANRTGLSRSNSSKGSIRRKPCGKWFASPVLAKMTGINGPALTFQPDFESWISPLDCVPNRNIPDLRGPSRALLHPCHTSAYPGFPPVLTILSEFLRKSS
jgi:hypothetical protein